MSTNQLDIYVRSSPLGEVGIHWRNITKPEQPKEEPSILKKRIIYRNDGKKLTINSLINDTKPSIILARYDGKILLEVAGLDALASRSKRLGRRISEVIVWVGNESNKDIESKLRELASYALLNFLGYDDKFINIVKSAIDFNGLDSFLVDLQRLENLCAVTSHNLNSIFDSCLHDNSSISASIWTQQYRLNSSNSSVISLANKLSITPLTNSKNPIVSVIEIKNVGEHKELLFNGNAWTAPPKPTPQNIPENLIENETASLVKKKPIQKPNPSKSRIIFFSVILLIMTLTLTLILTGTKLLSQKPQPTSSPVEPTKTPEIEPTKTPEIEPTKTPEIEPTKTHTLKKILVDAKKFLEKFRNQTKNQI